MRKMLERDSQQDERKISGDVIWGTISVAFAFSVGGTRRIQIINFGLKPDMDVYARNTGKTL